MAKFMTPVIQDNPSGWGPCAVPEQFRDMPYQPFSKGDRLGKVLSPFSWGSCSRAPRFLLLSLWLFFLRGHQLRKALTPE